MASKRSPQTAAKREREMAVKEKRERKRQRRQAAIAAREAGPVLEDGLEVEGALLDGDEPADGELAEETPAVAVELEGSGPA